MQILELDDVRWSRYAISRDPLSTRLTWREREEIARRARDTGTHVAQTMRKALGSGDPEVLFHAYKATVEERPEHGGCGLYLFAQFQEPDQVLLYQETVQSVERFILRRLPERFHVPVRKLVLAHELFHIWEYRHPDIPTRNMTAPFLSLGSHSWRRKLTAPSEIGAMSFAKALLDPSFHPQCLDILLLCALEEPGVEEAMEHIFQLSRGEGK